MINQRTSSYYKAELRAAEGGWDASGMQDIFLNASKTPIKNAFEAETKGHFPAKALETT